MRRLRGRAPARSSLLAFLLGLGVVLAAGARAAGPPEWDDIKNPYEGNVKAIEEGRELFSERCSFCHGTLGRGAKGPCLTCGHFYYRGGTNSQLFSTITGGIPGGQMGAFASSLTGDEIWRIIAFLRYQTEKDHPEALKER